VNEVKGQLITERLNEREGTLSVWQRFAGFVGLASRGRLHSIWYTQYCASQLTDGLPQCQTPEESSGRRTR
jgi:hypothetical protein